MSEKTFDTTTVQGFADYLEHIRVHVSNVEAKLWDVRLMLDRDIASGVADDPAKNNAKAGWEKLFVAADELLAASNELESITAGQRGPSLTDIFRFDDDGGKGYLN